MHAEAGQISTLLADWSPSVVRRLHETSLQETMFKNLLFDGIRVEYLNTQPSILLPASDDKRYVWKVEDEYLAGIEKIKSGLNSESKKLIW